MKVTIAYNKEKNGIELFFTGDFPEELAIFLREVGFKESLGNKKKWYADKHPAYVNYANSLREVLAKEGDWKSVQIQPSFTASEENIDTNKFSLVTFHYRGKEKAEKVSFVVFDSYKKVATYIASEFAIEKFGEDFKDLEVFPRNHKRKARLLLQENQVIDGTPSFRKRKNQELSAKKQEKLDLNLEENKTVLKEELKENKSGVNYDEVLNEVISELLQLEEKAKGESETIIGTTLFDLEEALEQTNILAAQKLIDIAVENFKNWVYDLDDTVRSPSISAINKLVIAKGEALIPFQEKQLPSDVKSIPKDIFSRDHIVKNVLVPIKAAEPFQSGGLNLGDGSFLKFKFSHLYRITDDNLSEVSGLELFQLSQMAHPKDYGMQVNRSALLQEWESRGPEAFQEIGYPTELDYPYVNIHTGYRSVQPLGSEIGTDEDARKWWSVVEHARPIAEPSKGIAIIDEMLLELVEKRQDLINPKTGKPKSDKISKEGYNEIEWQISRLEISKTVIQDYLNKDVEDEYRVDELSKHKEQTSKNLKTKADYIDRVIAVMHTSYSDAQRLSKKKIEALKKETGAPSLGALWEAVELSWLLWYKMLYKEPIAFENRLNKMVQFWNNVQPTYAYSDSSKELYKQYSTPCPIGAIVAQYTGMDEAEFIFEPSAGNGLLLVGANPRITHVNEIDKSRKQSLKYQNFGRITSENAAQPFPEMMNKVHDVVVTNPPFAKWEASKFDKERIANKYFNKQRGIASHIRLEHLMAGLALHTMKDDGKAAIIIMGHVYYGEDGLLAKYRPFFNWLYRHYLVDDIINMNSYKLYNKQGAVTKTMLILIDGRKSKPSGVAPNKSEKPHLENMVESFEELWEEVKLHIKSNIDSLIEQLKIAQTK